MRARTVLTLSGIIIAAASLTACAGGSDSQAPAAAGEPVAETMPTVDGGGDAKGGLFAQSEDIFPDCEKLVELSGGLLDDMILASSEIISPPANSSQDPLTSNCVWSNEAAAEGSLNLEDHANAGITITVEPEPMLLEDFEPLGLAFSVPQTEEHGAFLLNSEDKLKLSGPAGMMGPILVKGNLSVSVSATGAMVNPANGSELTNQDLLDAEVKILEYIEAR